MESELRTVPAELHHWATTDPHTPAFIFVDAAGGRCELSRADLFRFSSRYAAMLRRQGVQKGTVVVNTLPNSPERLLTDLGVVLAGGVAMNGQIFLADGEDFVGSLKGASAFAVILNPKEPKGAAKVMEKRTHTEKESGQVDYPELPALKRVFQVAFKENNTEERPLFKLLENEEESYVADVTLCDMADIWTTSGSTGFSKLVPVTHQGAINFGNYFYDFLHPNPGEIYYNDRSLGWAGGFPGVFLTHGTTRVLLDVSQGLPDDVIRFEWDVIRRERCTVAFLVPSQLLQMTDLRHQEREGEGKQYKLRAIGSGGQPLLKKHMEAIGKITDSIHVGYGSTETGIISVKVVTSKEDYEDNNNGTPVSGVTLRVVDEELQDQPLGQLGQILVKSRALFDGYLNNQEATQRAFTEDGWFKTGDVGFFNSKGEIFTVCRQAFSIMRGPYLLYPGWLERRLSRCPDVGDVMIVPVPDPVLYQELCACVVPRPDAQLTSEGLKSFCETLFLTSEKSEMTAVPKYYLFFDAFPTTNTGKTSRRETAVVARQRLGFEDNVPGPRKNE